MVILLIEPRPVKKNHRREREKERERESDGLIVETVDVKRGMWLVVGLAFVSLLASFSANFSVFFFFLYSFILIIRDK